MKKFCTSVIFIALCVCPAWAQGNQYEFIRASTFKTGVHAKLWDFEDESGFDKFAELSFPTTYSMAFGDRFAIDLVTAPFVTALQLTDGPVLDYSNLSDSFGRVSVMLGDNLALLTFGVGIPSGQTELKSEELVLAGLAANRPLSNPITNFGAGLNLHFGVAVAQNFGAWVVGAGAGYALRGDYDILFDDENIQIDPGDEMNLTLGVDREFRMAGGQGRFMADFIYTNYTEDEFKNLSFVYEAGDKIVVSGNLILPLGFVNPLILSARNRWRLDNKAQDPLLLDNGNELELRATGISALSGSFKLKYIYRAQIYGENDQGIDGALIHGFGGGLILKLSRHFSFDPTFIYSVGSIDTGPDSDVAVTGYEFSGGFAITF